MVADEVKGKVNATKIEEMDCIRGYSRSKCCKSKIFAKTEPCKKPLCIELACKEKDCGDACELPYKTRKKTDSKATLKCNPNGKCLRTREPKYFMCGGKRECKKDEDCKCWCYR